MFPPKTTKKQRNQKSQSGGSIEVRIFDLESAFDLNRFGEMGHGLDLAEGPLARKVEVVVLTQPMANL